MTPAFPKAPACPSCGSNRARYRMHRLPWRIRHPLRRRPRFKALICPACGGVHQKQ